MALDVVGKRRAIGERLRAISAFERLHVLVFVSAHMLDDVRARFGLLRADVALKVHLVKVEDHVTSAASETVRVSGNRSMAAHCLPQLTSVHTSSRILCHIR